MLAAVVAILVIVLIALLASSSPGSSGSKGSAQRTAGPALAVTELAGIPPAAPPTCPAADAWMQR